jgi:hypothetical protein
MKQLRMFAVLLCPAIYAQAPYGSRLDIRVIDRKGPPVPKPEPGDDVKIEAATGELVATSRGLTMRFRHRAAEMKPRVDASLFELSPNTHRLEYRLTNAPDATLAIGGFLLEYPDPSSVNWSLPSGWAAIPRGNRLLPPAVLLTKITPDSYERLSAGQTVSFLASGPALPGVIRYTILPEPVRFKPGELTDGQFFDGASAWVRMKMLELDTPDRHEAKGVLIGAKIAAGQDGIDKLYAEFREASESRELSTASRESFVSLSQTKLTKDQLRVVISGMSTPTAFERAFRQAMLLRLSHLP